MPEQARHAGPYVFLSYASPDRARALHIADLLEGQGIHVWIDRHSIEGGTAWSTEIVRGVKCCAALVVLCSPTSMVSPNVHRELNLAVEENRPILPVLLERVPLPDEVRYALAGRQWVEVFDRPDEAWLPSTLRALATLGVGPSGRIFAKPSPSPRQVQSPVEPEVGAGTPLSELPPAQLRHPGPRSNDTPLGRLLARAPLVGRVDELDFLKAQYEEIVTLGRGGRLIFISGEPGTGKTRLAQEVGNRAIREGGLFLTGHYLREGTAAYGPWVEALRPVLRDLPPQELVDLIGSRGPELAQSVPELVEPLGPFPPPAALSPDDQRRRLFDAFADLVINLSRRTPLVLLLDDLQWAPGLSVLMHLARRLGESRALILGTYREQEFHEQSALVREWAELNRSRLALQLSVHPLSEAETTQLVAHYLGERPAERLRRPIYQRTRGNAFFAEEVVRSLAESGAVRPLAGGWEVVEEGHITLPESVKLAVEERVARLGEEPREILTQAAILGQEFSFADLLGRVGKVITRAG